MSSLPLRPTLRKLPILSLQPSRGAKKLSRPTGLTPVKLLKDLPTFGRAGSIVPIPTGQMRNRFFPLRIADYVTLAERRAIKNGGLVVERDYNFGREEEEEVVAAAAVGEEGSGFGGMGRSFGGFGKGAEGVEVSEKTWRSRNRNSVVEVEKVTPERSLELLEIFVKSRLDFYRQPLPPIVEEKDPEAVPQQKERFRTASSAAADLLEARSSALKPLVQPDGPQGIYGSVSAQDVLVAVRAAMSSNDEAARVALREEDVEFLDENVVKAVKFTGDYTVEIRVKGAERGIRRTVRVVGQEAV